MDRDELRDDQWEWVSLLIPGGSEGKRGREPTIGVSSMRCFGWLTPEHDEKICRPISVPFRRSIGGIIDGWSAA